MTLFNVLIKICSSSLISIVFSVIAVKVIAMNLGPEGVGEFGILRDVIKLSIFFISFSCSNAIIHAINNENIKNNSLYLANLFKILFSMCLFAGPLVFYLTYSYFDIELSNNYSLLMYVLIMIVGSLNVVNIAILNAYKKINTIAISQVLSSIISLLGLIFILYADLVLDEIIVYFFLLYIVWYMINLHSMWKFNLGVDIKKIISSKFEKGNVSHIVKFSGANLVTTVCGLLTILLMKNTISDNLGPTSLGLLEASWTISTIYIALISSSIGAYVLPKLSSKSSWEKDENLTILSESIFLLSFFVSLAVMVIISNRNLIINILYSSEFYESAYSLSIFVLSDLFKVISILVGYFLISYGSIKSFIFSSISWNLIFLISFYSMLEIFGINASAYAYLISNVVLFAVSVYLLNNELNIDLKLSEFYFFSFSIVFILVVFLFNIYWEVQYIYCVSLIFLYVFITFLIRRLKLDSCYE